LNLRLSTTRSHRPFYQRARSHLQCCITVVNELLQHESFERRWWRLSPHSFFIMRWGVLARWCVIRKIVLRLWLIELFEFFSFTWWILSLILVGSGFVDGLRLFAIWYFNINRFYASIYVGWYQMNKVDLLTWMEEIKRIDTEVFNRK